MKTTVYEPIHRAASQFRPRFGWSAHTAPSQRQLGGCQAFTRIELVVSVIVSCLLATAMFLTTIPSGKAGARSAVCLNNLREIDLGLNQYALEFQQFLNASEWGAAALDSAGARFEPYLPQNPEALICPDKQHSAPTTARPEALVAFELLSYGYNGAGTAPDGREMELGMGLFRHIATSRVKVPSDMIVLGDSGVGIQSSSVLSPTEIASLKESALPAQPQLPSTRHGGGANILFCDGHVSHGKQSKWIEKTSEARRQWNNDNQPHRETW